MNVPGPRHPLDRADHLRADPEALSELIGARARLLRLDGLEPHMAEDGSLAWGALADCAGDAELIFLGLDGDRGGFAAVPSFARRVLMDPGRAGVEGACMGIAALRADSACR